MFEVDKFMHKPFFEREPLCDHPVHHHEHMHHEKPHYTMTEEVEHATRLMRETIDRLLRFEKRLKDEITDLSKTLMSDNVIFKNTMHESWNTFLMEVKNEINIFESTTTAELNAFKAELESNYANLSEDVRKQIVDSLEDYEQKLSEAIATINERIEQNNTIHEEAFADFQRSITTQLNTFEQTMTAQFNNFMESVNTTLHTFKDAWESVIETRLNSQDAKLDDMEMYMKTNLTSTVTTLIGDMHANGEFTEIIEGEVFNDLQRKVDGFGRVSVLYFGAVGDGETDNTNAFKLAVNSGFRLFVPRGVFKVGNLTLPAYCDIQLEGEIHNSHDEGQGKAFYSSRHAVIDLTGAITLSPHCRIEGGVFFTEGVAFKIPVADANHQGIELDNVTVIGDGSTSAVGVLIDASDNSNNKGGYLTLSRFNMLINRCYYGYRINRPQTNGRHPWITFVTFEGSLTDCYQGVSTEYGSIAHANGSGIYNLICCGGASYKNADKAYIDISGDMPVVNCLFSDMGENHSIKYGLDLTGTIHATVYNYQQGNPLIKGLSLHGERYPAGGMLMELVNNAMPNGKVYAVRSGGTIDYIFTGTFAPGQHVNFGEKSPYTRAPIDTTYRDAETNLLIQMPGSNQNVLVSNATGDDIVLATPIKISVPHHTIN